MPRRARNVVALDDKVVHVLNRGNCRMNLFGKPGDFAAFLALLEDARRRFPSIRILGYCLMHNHWHLVLWPRRGADLPRFIGWLCSTHVRRWRTHRGNVGLGHLYQGRYKSFVVQDDEHHALVLLRYVEANPRRARMVRRAQDWAWSSCGNGLGTGNVRVELSDWPIDRPRNWMAIVNERLPEPVLDRLRMSVRRDRPFGADAWTKRIARQLGAESTLRHPWRPRKQPLAKPGSRKSRSAAK